MATKRSKKKPEEKRIYVLLPLTVQVPPGGHLSRKPVSIPMEAGRLMAQGEHVVSKMRMENIDIYGKDPITTINLSVRNSAELTKVMRELEEELNIERFRDKNPEFYGTPFTVLTAVCTVPVFRSWVEDVIGHLELYRAPGE
jgi:hypothetical protein